MTALRRRYWMGLVGRGVKHHRAPIKLIVGDNALESTFRFDRTTKITEVGLYSGRKATRPLTKNRIPGAERITFRPMETLTLHWRLRVSGDGFPL